MNQIEQRNQHTKEDNIRLKSEIEALEKTLEVKNNELKKEEENAAEFERTIIELKKEILSKDNIINLLREGKENAVDTIGKKNVEINDLKSMCIVSIYIKMEY